MKRDEGGLSLSLGDRKESEKKQEDRIMTRHRIAARILSADFARLGEEARQVADAGARWFAFDVIENSYGPNLPPGPMLCARRARVSMPIPSAPAGKFASKSMAGSTRTISPPSRPPAPILLLRVQQFSGSPTIAPRFRRCAARSRTAP